jgi:hypothetical protein
MISVVKLDRAALPKLKRQMIKARHYVWVGVSFPFLFPTNSPLYRKRDRQVNGKPDKNTAHQSNRVMI